MLKIDDVIDGKYRLVKLLGQGGMGTVFVAEHLVLGKKVAIKFLHTQYADSQEAIKRFYREAQAAAAVGHEGIVEVHDIGTSEDGSPFLVMEILHGESLFEIITRQGRIDVDAAIEIAVQASSALIAVHKQGIIHRDLKPENLFVCYKPDGSELVKILDFGVSKVTAAKAGARLTQTGVVLGTAYYMSPEQARGRRDVDHGVDIWAMGVILYEMLTGHLPFNGENYNEVLVRLLEGDFIPPRTLNPEIPIEIEAIVLKAMASSQEKRYPRMVDFLHDLLATREQATYIGPVRRKVEVGLEQWEDDDLTVVDPQLSIANKTTHLFKKNSKEGHSAGTQNDDDISSRTTAPKTAPGQKRKPSIAAETLSGISKRKTTTFRRRSRTRRAVGLISIVGLVSLLAAGVVWVGRTILSEDEETRLQTDLHSKSTQTLAKVTIDQRAIGSAGKAAELPAISKGFPEDNEEVKGEKIKNDASEEGYPSAIIQSGDGVSNNGLKQGADDLSGQGKTPQPQVKVKRLTREEVSNVLSSLTAKVSSCLPARNPSLQVKALVQIEGNGTANLLTISPYQSSKVFSCVRKAVSTARLRESGQPAITVVYPYRGPQKKLATPGFLPRRPRPPESIGGL
jgi:serine/threonine protein kinase